MVKAVDKKEFAVAKEDIFKFFNCKFKEQGLAAPFAFAEGGGGSSTGCCGPQNGCGNPCCSGCGGNG